MQQYLENLKEFLETHTKEEACLHFELSMETMNRYIRSINNPVSRKSKGNGTNFPNILIVDIETAPMKGYFFRLWKQTIRPEQIDEDWFILGWSAKWLYDDKMFSEYVTPKEAVNLDDKRIMKPLWHLMDAADMICAHNAKKFDEPRINTRFFIHGFKPVSPYQKIDTLYYYKKQFKFSSNKLDFINKTVHLTQKVDTAGLDMWKRCKNGDQEALDDMKEYNINDVYMLEENYLKIRPWIKNHPNIGVYMENDELTCSNCGSTNLKPDGEYVTPVNKYPTYRCNDCGAIAGRERKTAISKEKKESILRAQAR